MTTFTPIGRRVLLHPLPRRQSNIVVPDSANNPNASRFEVRGIGPEVDREKYPLEMGDIVQLANPPTTMAGVDGQQQLLTVIDMDIHVIVKEAEGDE